ncbi:hypothetical protein AC629_39520 [Bradyrhizobium sp. NAS80.1]|uniref:hypothetical protein n=1 Tax=Bradyrhizobium sp. NAS80.1 TaxID=1680159 RepID=UPI00095C1776|nr:hypothetical protein [Bradyrhizobium sp. NAS80.1]OKO71215.1 hypothetical protein AC629_39520 [Bradyrhizobium sp. NAS80.1]
METTAYRPSRESRAFDLDEVTTYPHTYGASYLRERAGHTDLPPHDPVPLFLSDPEGEPDPREFTPRRARPRARLIVQIVAGVLAAVAVAVTVTLFQSDISRLLIVNAEASIKSLVADRSTVPASPQPARQISLKDPARVSNAVLTSAEAKEVSTSVPSREAIASAYQAALQTQPPAAAPLPQMPAPFDTTPAPAPAKPASLPARTLDAATLASLMTRARSVMAIGDITSARLLLERAANAQDATAAFLLGQTFDPAVLGTQDIRSINADPATARDWYQKAAQLGSAEARQRLTQLQN